MNRRLNFSTVPKKGKGKKFRDRCRLILLKDEGRPSKEVAALMNMSHMNITLWLRRFRNEGIEGLKTRHRVKRGPKLRFDKERDGELVRKIMEANNYVVKDASKAFNAATGRKISINTMRRFINDLKIPTSLVLERKEIHKKWALEKKQKAMAKAMRRKEEEEKELRRQGRARRKKEIEKRKIAWEEQKRVWALKKKEKEELKKKP